MKEAVDKQEPEVEFAEHMKEKAVMWGAYQVHIGEDFAVFEFDTQTEMEVVHKTLQHYQGVYGYKSYAGPRERMSIVKGEKST